MSGVLQNIDRYEVVFDDEGLVADTGLLVAGTLMGRLGLEDLVDRTVRGWVARTRVLRCARW